MVLKLKVVSGVLKIHINHFGFLFHNLEIMLLRTSLYEHIKNCEIVCCFNYEQEQFLNTSMLKQNEQDVVRDPRNFGEYSGYVPSPVTFFNQFDFGTRIGYIKKLFITVLADIIGMKRTQPPDQISSTVILMMEPCSCNQSTLSASLLFNIPLPS